MKNGARCKWREVNVGESQEYEGDSSHWGGRVNHERQIGEEGGNIYTHPKSSDHTVSWE